MRTFFLAICLFCFQLAMAESLPKGIIEAKVRPAPTLVLSDMDGKTSDLSKSRGRWTFVHFWASWCGPCRKEMPSIQKLITTMQDSNIDFYIINTAENEDTIFEFLAATSPDLNTLLDRDGLATEAWQPRGLPATYLVDPAGIVRYQALGGREWNSTPYKDFITRLITSTK